MKGFSEPCRSGKPLSVTRCDDCSDGLFFHLVPAAAQYLYLFFNTKGRDHEPQPEVSY